MSTLLLAPGCAGDDPPPAGAVSSTANGSGSAADDETGGEESDTGDESGMSIGDVPTDDLPCEDPPPVSFTKMEGVFGTAPMGGTFDEGNCPPGYLNPGEPDCQGESAGLGLSAGDYDGDGLVDLFFGNAFGPAALYHNEGDGSFTEVSSSVGLDLTMNPSTGSAWLDADKDGDLDLYVLTSQGNRQHYYRNDGGTFTEVGQAVGLDMSSTENLGSISVAVGDYDLDGWPDLWVTGWRMTTPADTFLVNRLFRNLGAANPGHFEDLTQSAGLQDAARAELPFAEQEFYVGFASSWTDVDHDDYPELIIAGDFGADEIYRNQGDGSFEDVTLEWGMGQAMNGMGLAVGDLDRDGDLDWMTGSIALIHGSCQHVPNMMMGNRLYMNRLNEPGADTPLYKGDFDAKVACGAWSWGTVMADIDNDGDVDLAQTNGWFGVSASLQLYQYDIDRLWINPGDPLEGMQHCGGEVGFDDDNQGRALIALDIDVDGDLDFLATRAGGIPLVYRNDGGNEADYLRVELRGTQSMTFGRGARIALRSTDGGPWQIEEIGQSSHFAGHGELVAHFGLGEAPDTLHELRVCWPASGLMQKLNDVSPNAQITLNEDDADIAVDGPCADAVTDPAYD